MKLLRSKELERDGKMLSNYLFIKRVQGFQIVTLKMHKLFLNRHSQADG